MKAKMMTKIHKFEFAFWIWRTAHLPEWIWNLKIIIRDLFRRTNHESKNNAG